MTDVEQPPMVALSADGISATVNPLGAELHTFRDGADRDLLWDGDPAFWTGRAPILFPVIGVLANDRYRLDGTYLPMPKHGFARHSLFDVIEQKADAATFRLEPADATRALFPFDFRLDIRFALTDRTLTVTAVVANRGKMVMPASLGFHPAFRWPLPYGGDRADHRIRFAKPEPAPIRRLDADGLLSPTRHPTPIDGRDLKLDDALFVEDALIFDNLESRSLTYCVDGGPELTIAFPDMPWLGVWTKPGAGYICIEPWHGSADPAGFDDDIFAKPGIVAIAPGDERSFSMAVTLPA